MILLITEDKIGVINLWEHHTLKFEKPVFNNVIGIDPRNFYLIMYMHVYLIQNAFHRIILFFAEGNQ